MSSLLQRELDFSAFDTTGEDLLNYWTQHSNGRVIRSHRAAPRVSPRVAVTVLAVIVGLTVASIGALGVAPARTTPQSGAVAAPIHPLDIELSPVEPTNGVDQVELRGGDQRSSRSHERETRGDAPVARPRATVTTTTRPRSVTSTTPPPAGQLSDGGDDGVVTSPMPGIGVDVDDGEDTPRKWRNGKKNRGKNVTSDCPDKPRDVENDDTPTASVIPPDVPLVTSQLG